LYLHPRPSTEECILTFSEECNIHPPRNNIKAKDPHITLSVPQTCLDIIDVAKMKHLWTLVGAAAAAISASNLSPAQHHHANVHSHSLRQDISNTTTIQPSCPDSNATTYASNNESFVIECGVDRPGPPISFSEAASLGECVDLCANTTSCELVSGLV